MPDDFLDDPLWYKDAVIYELHVRSFYDSNNDGYGDFQGLREKLPYLGTASSPTSPTSISTTPRSGKR